MNIGLKAGARGADVRELQQVLGETGYDIRAGEVGENEFGLSTLAALHAFQKQRNLPPTDVIDAPTLQALMEVERGAGGRPQKAGTSGSAAPSPVPTPTAAAQPSQPSPPPASTPPPSALAGQIPPRQPAQPPSQGGESGQPPANGGGRGTVRGKLVDQDGAPIPNTRVALFAVYLRNETQLGAATTNQIGEYAISYDRPAPVNLVVRACQCKVEMSGFLPSRNVRFQGLRQG